MRRVGLAVTVVLGMVLVGALPAAAAPVPGPTAKALRIPVPQAQKPATVCTISSDGNGAVHMTGLVATANGYVTIDGDNPDWLSKRVVYLNSKCVRTSLRAYPGGGAADPQDLAIDSKGVLWVADTGDDPSAPKRPTVALWKVATNGTMTLYRFSYPDGAQNAEALVLDGDGTPILITKSATGPASLYAPDGTMSSGATTTLKKVGAFKPEQTGTPTKFGLSGQNWVTGGANSPDGKRVVLRTYSDAYEWTVTGGDVIAAITKGTPTITPLPDDTQGEAIAFTPDGTSFLTLSNTAEDAQMFKWMPASPTSVTKAKAKATPATPGFLRSWFNSLSLTELMMILAGVAVFGLLLVIAGVMGIRRFRAAQRAAARRAAREAPLRPGVARAAVPVGGPPVPPGVYGAPNPSPGYGGPARPPQDPYAYPAQGRYADPYADPYAQPEAHPPAAYGGGQYGGGQYGGGQYSGVQYGGGGAYPPAVDPYDDGGQVGYQQPDGRPRSSGAYPEDPNGYGDYRG